MKRAQNKVRRILTLLSALSQLRMPFTIQEAEQLLKERDEISANVCTRTIQRDMELLVSMEFAKVHRKGQPGKGGSSGIVTQYKMTLQTVGSASYSAFSPSGIVASTRKSASPCSQSPAAS